MSEAEEESKTVTMSRHQYEKIRQYSNTVLELATLMEPITEETEATPKATLELELIGNGLADILEDVEAGRLDHGKMVRPVPAEPKGGAQ